MLFEKLFTKNAAIIILACTTVIFAWIAFLGNRAPNETVKCLTPEEITRQINEFSNGLPQSSEKPAITASSTNLQTNVNQADMAKEFDALKKKFAAQPDTEATRLQQAKDVQVFMQKYYMR